MKRAVAFLLTCGLVLQSTAGNPVFVLAEPGNMDSPITEADSSSLEENEENSHSTQEIPATDTDSGEEQEEPSGDVQATVNTEATETDDCGIRDSC